MKNLKRDNFTVDEIIDLINDRLCIDEVGNEPHILKEYNDAVRSVADMFYDFQRPVEEMGAMAYDIDTKLLVHVGHIPDEMKIPMVRNNKK